MKHKKILIVVVGLCVQVCVAAQPSSPDGGPKIVAYFPNWIELDSFSKDIDYGKLTHINIAFENPTNAAGDISFNPQDDALLTAAHAHQVKVLLSIGGGSVSEDQKMRRRYLQLMGDTNRPAFVAKIVDYVEHHGFDGLDVDLEGRAINQYYGAFIADLARGLKSRNKLLTAALSQGNGGSSVADQTLADFDYINLMAYDETGPWEPKSPGQHSSFDYATTTVAYWLKRGLPKSKAILGVPFYGWGFGEAFSNDEYGYADILKTYPGAEQFDQIGHTIWYNGLPTIKAKSWYVKENGLGGVMIWSLDHDAKGESSLLCAIFQILQSPKN